MKLPWKQTAKKYKHLYIAADEFLMEFENKAFEAGLIFKIITEPCRGGDLYKGYELINERAEKAEAELEKARKELAFRDMEEYDGEDDGEDRDGYCETCGGTGVIITCCDDLCVGGDHCIHGDGEEICPNCHGGY